MQLQLQSLKTRMASRSSSMLACVVVVMVFCLTEVKAALASDCTVSGDANGCSHVEAASPATRHRKVFISATEEEEEEKSGFEGTEMKKEYKTVAERWKLREVPLGPDPLHHDGDPPKKPRTR